MCAESNSEVLYRSFSFLDLVGVAWSINQVIVFCLVSGSSAQIKGSADHRLLDTLRFQSHFSRLSMVRLDEVVSVLAWIWGGGRHAISSSNQNQIASQI